MEERVITAIYIHRTIKTYNPPVVLRIPFQKKLKLKIGAKVMMNYNVDLRMALEENLLA